MGTKARPIAKFNKSDWNTWRLWKFLRENGTQGYVVLEPGGVDPIAIISGVGKDSLRKALAIQRRGRFGYTLLLCRDLVGAVLLPLDARGKIFTLDARGKVLPKIMFTSGHYTADGYFAVAIGSVTEELLGKVKEARRAKRAAAKARAKRGTKAAKAAA